MGQLCCRAAPPEAVKGDDIAGVSRISAHDANGLPKRSSLTDAVEAYELGTSVVTVVANPAVDFSPRHSVSSESYYSVSSHLAEDDLASEGALALAGPGLAGAPVGSLESPVRVLRVTCMPGPALPGDQGRLQIRVFQASSTAPACILLRCLCREGFCAAWVHGLERGEIGGRGARLEALIVEHAGGAIPTPLPIPFDYRPWDARVPGTRRPLGCSATWN